MFFHQIIFKKNNIKNIYMFTEKKSKYIYIYICIARKNKKLYFIIEKII